MANETFTLIVVPDHHGAEVKRFKLQKKRLFQLGGALSVVLMVAVVAVAHYFTVVSQAL